GVMEADEHIVGPARLGTDVAGFAQSIDFLTAAPPGRQIRPDQLLQLSDLTGGSPLISSLPSPRPQLGRCAAGTARPPQPSPARTFGRLPREFRAIQETRCCSHPRSVLLFSKPRYS